MAGQIIRGDISMHDHRFRFHDNYRKRTPWTKVKILVKNRLQCSMCGKIWTKRGCCPERCPKCGRRIVDAI